MNYALVLAGGTGSRMNSKGVPKQFMSINGKPIIIYTIENMMKNKDIDKFIAVCNKDYVAYLQDLLVEFNLADKVDVTVGGDSRLESTLNGIKYIEDHFKVTDEDIFIAHDSVRPFTNQKIFEENIKCAKESKAATTVFNVCETILETNSEGVFKLYPRNNIFNGQSPQTFNINYFLECTNKIPKDVQKTFTDLSNNITYCDGIVTPVLGDRANIKITYPIDLDIAKSMLDNQ